MNVRWSRCFCLCKFLRILRSIDNCPNALKLSSVWESVSLGPRGQGEGQGWRVVGSGFWKVWRIWGWKSTFSKEDRLVAPTGLFGIHLPVFLKFTCFIITFFMLSLFIFFAKVGNVMCYLKTKNDLFFHFEVFKE